MSCSIEYNGQVYTPDEFKQYISDNIVDFSKFMSKTEKKVDYVLKSIELLLSDKAIKVFNAAKKGNWTLEKTLIELQIPTAQRNLILSFNKIDREDIVIELLSNYSYTIEINTAKTSSGLEENFAGWQADNISPYTDFEYNGSKYLKKEELDFDGETRWYYYRDSKKISKSDFTSAAKEAEKIREAKPTQYYSNLTVPGGTAYTENEIATPAIIPSIKGHAQFATDKGIGWFRSDDKVSEQKKEFSDLLNKNKIEDADRLNELRKTKDLPTKIRRILEIQSDVFQKGRDIKSPDEIIQELQKQGKLKIKCD